jgi:hypothetical protein
MKRITTNGSYHTLCMFKILRNPSRFFSFLFEANAQQQKYIKGHWQNKYNVDFLSENEFKTKKEKFSFLHIPPRHNYLQKSQNLFWLMQIKISATL